MQYARDIFKFKDIGRLKVKGWKNIYHVKSNQKRALLAIVVLRLDKMALKTKFFIKDNMWQLYKYVSNSWALKCMKQKINKNEGGIRQIKQ